MSEYTTMIDNYPELDPRENMDETVLSEQMSGLSTTVATNDMNIIDHGLMLIDKTIRDRLEILPNYLTKENATFQAMIDKALTMLSRTISNDNNNQDDQRNALEQISILIYKVNVLTKFSSLWTTYWKSGIGQLIPRTPPLFNHVPYAKYVCIWPKEIKRLMKLVKDKTQYDTMNSMFFVDYHRQQIEQQLTQTRIEWNRLMNQMGGYNIKVEDLLETYINQHLNEFQMEIQHKIKLVTYDYHIEAIRREFDLKNPTEYQNKLMKETCLKAYEREMAEQDYQFLQERINNFKISMESLNYSALIPSTMIDSIENLELREQIFDQYMTIIQQAKDDFYTLSLQTAEQQRNKTRSNSQDHDRKLQSIHDKALDKTILPLSMIDLIHERCRWISERIQCVHEYKMECFRLKSKTHDGQ